MRLVKSFILLLTIVFASHLGAQQLIPEDELKYQIEYNPASLKEVNPDSVFCFVYWGTVYGFEDGEKDSVFNLEDLLRCRNLQKLILQNVPASDLPAKLDHFPLLQQLELKNVGLEEFPQQVYQLPYLKNLALWNVFLSSISDENQINSKIRRFEIYSCDISCNDEDICTLRFDLLPELMELSIGNSNMNNLDFLPACKKLEHLEIFDCENIAKMDLGTLENLHFLMLENVALETAPLGLSALTNLTDLNISACPFVLEGDMLENSTRLENLILTGGTASDISFVGELINLNSLNISNNGITELPELIGNCVNLTSLTAPGNNISILPAGLCRLQNLNYLDLENNSISEIPAAFSGLKSLRTVYLNFNPLRNIAMGASNLPELRYLHLSYTGIKNLPADFGNFKGLYELEFTGDSLTTITPEIFKMTELTYLNVANNQISDLPSGWESLTTIFSINLSGNMLKKLPDDICKLQGLRNLNVENNKLKALPSGIAKMPELGYLVLGGNSHIKYPKGLEKLKNLLFVYLNADDLNAKETMAWKKKLGEKLQIAIND